MNKFARAVMGRILAGWAVFLIGLVLLQWLHTFRDNVAHQAIGPLFLLLWVLLLLCVWGGCKTVALRLRYALFTIQVAASVVVCMLFFQHLISQSI